MDNWWYAKGGQRHGPVSQEQLQTLISSGHVAATDLVWSAGMARWQTVAETESLKNRTAVPMPANISATAMPDEPQAQIRATVITSSSTVITSPATVPTPIPAAGTSVPTPTPYKRRFLAWWGLFPAIAFLVVQCVYGWPEAKARATGPDFAISYLMGGIITGLFISLVPAWILYRLLNRSQLAGTITFSVAICLFCLSVYERTRPWHSPSSPSSVSPAGSLATVRLPTFGVSLASPTGWLRLQPDKPRIIARWISPESRAAQVQGMILVESGKSTSPDGGDVARGLAKSWGGRIASEHEDVDGERAWRVLADPVGSAMQPVEGLVTIHEGHTFLIEGGTTQSRTCHEQIELIRRTWKWIPVDPPTQHLEFQDQPLIAFDGKVSVNFPAIMSSMEDGQSKQAISLGLYNLKRDMPDFDAFLQLAELDPGDTLRAATERLGKGIQEKFKLPEAFVWHDINGSHQGAISQTVRGPSEGGINWIIWAMVRLDEKRLVLINFTIYASDQSDRTTYAAVAQKIAESISPTRMN